MRWYAKTVRSGIEQLSLELLRGKTLRFCEMEFAKFGIVKS
jgi:hypothetical protein